MSRRFSRIQAATRYYAAVDNYIKYITDATRRSTRVGQGKARPRSQKLFIDPFGLKLASGQRVPVSAAQPAWTTYSGRFGGHTEATPPTDEDLIVKPADYRAARVIIVSGRSQTGVVKTSAITGMKYLSYGGDSTSIPFGRKNETETELAAFEEIKAAINPEASNLLVTHQKEKF